jgi:hypothetical protein
VRCRRRRCDTRQGADGGGLDRREGQAAAKAVAEVSQTANGALRVKFHDKHAALPSIGKHLRMFTDNVQIKAVYGIRDTPMTAEEWKKQFVKPG